MVRLGCKSSLLLLLDDDDDEELLLDDDCCINAEAASYYDELKLTADANPVSATALNRVCIVVD